MNKKVITIFMLTLVLAGCQSAGEINQLLSTIKDTHQWAQKGQACFQLTKAEQQKWAEKAVVFGLTGEADSFSLSVAQQACVQSFKEDWAQALKNTSLPVLVGPPVIEWSEKGLLVKARMGGKSPAWMHGIELEYLGSGSAVSCALTWPNASMVMLEALEQGLEMPCDLRTGLRNGL